MIAAPDFPDIDWANEDVRRLAEIFSERFDAMAQKKDEAIDRLVEENKQQADENRRQADEIKQQADEIKELKQEIERMKAAGGRRTRRSRSYNAREFKDYPRPEEYSKRRRPPDTGINHSMTHTIQETVTLKYCPECGERMPESDVSYDRTTEDSIDGRWTRTNWKVKRHYCRVCDCQYSASPEGVLPGEHFGINVMSQVSCMRCLAIPHEKIGKIIHMLYGRFIEVSNVIHLCDTVADHLKPLYDGLLERLAGADIINGDDTGWYYNKKHWHVWGFLTAYAALFHISSSRSKAVAEAILEGFEGIIIGDSHSSWNDVGSEAQRCLLHYFRDMYLTLKKNKGAEFKAFFEELHDILKTATGAWITHGERNERVPKRIINGLLKRIDDMTAGSYTDKDCIRYVKRLRRERNQLFTFLEHDGVSYHNNPGERVLRIFALMRKVCYGSRSIRGIRTTEILATIHSTCELRGIDPYWFMVEYLNGRLKSIPMPERQACIAAAA